MTLSNYPKPTKKCDNQQPPPLWHSHPIVCINYDASLSQTSVGFGLDIAPHNYVGHVLRVEVIYCPERTTVEIVEAVIVRRVVQLVTKLDFTKFEHHSDCKTIT
uniref:Uncharacterized protein n=1 Tax=Cannabis sativa TaxID=3483 RepID=A0A803Q8R4_CANSA